MARDRASIRVDMWADADWRALPLDAQHLYMLLLSHPTLNYAGVADWRPGRLAALTAGASADSVREAARALERGRFILVDEDTEEVLVRSFVKHDGLLKQPKLAVAMASAYAGVASTQIQQVIAFEVQKYRDKHPELSCWEHKQVRTILEAKASGIESFTHAFTPDETLTETSAVTPTGGQALVLPTTTTTTTATSPEGDIGARRRKPERPLPDEWGPSSSHQEYARANGLDIEHEADQFRAHALANDRRQRDWDQAFRTWLGNARAWGARRPTSSRASSAQEFISRLESLGGAG